MQALPFFTVGFCGLDDTVAPNDLENFFKDAKSLSFGSNIEFGFLFRKEFESSPRFVSRKGLEALLSTLFKYPNRLAAHICSDYCVQFLKGDYTFVEDLSKQGFKRVQVNMTAANGVHLGTVISEIAEERLIENVLNVFKILPEIEIILQYSEETENIIKKIVSSCSRETSNLSILFDSSKGTGKQITEFTPTIDTIPCGYAGGFGTNTIESILTKMALDKNAHENSRLRPLWIDMESSLRTVDGDIDKFDLGKVLQILKILEELLRNGIISLKVL